MEMEHLRNGSPVPPPGDTYGPGGRVSAVAAALEMVSRCL